MAQKCIKIGSKGTEEKRKTRNKLEDWSERRDELLEFKGRCLKGLGSSPSNKYTNLLVGGF